MNIIRKENIVTMKEQDAISKKKKETFRKPDRVTRNLK